MSSAHIMVVLIVMIVMIAQVMRARYRSGTREGPDPAEQAENLRLREEVKELKQRLHVLERIATDRENSLSREIEELRDR